MLPFAVPADEWGFAPAMEYRRAPDGRMVVGWQLNAEETYDRVFADGSGLTPVTSPRLKTVLEDFSNTTGDEG